MGDQQLVLQMEASHGFFITIDKEASVIGRGVDCDHTLDVKGVSCRHAQIRTTPESDWVVEDLESTNGTYLNGSRITGPAVLKLADIVTLGEAKLHVVQIGSGEQTVVVHDLTVLRNRWTGDPSADTTQSLRESVKRFFDLVEISKALSACASIDTIFQQVREVVFRYFDSVERIALMVDLQGDGTLSMLDSAMRSNRREPGEDWISWSICRQAQREKAAIQSADTLADDRFEGVPSIMAKGIRTAMAVPLWHEDKVVGVFYADASRPTENWENQARKELGFFSALGNLLAASLQRWLLTRKLQDEELFRSRLERYHSPSVIEKILAGALEEESLAPQGFDITVLFADIVGFTALSERLSPSAVARLLNAFFEEMLVEIFDEGGTRQVHRRRNHGFLRGSEGPIGPCGSMRARRAQDAEQAGGAEPDRQTGVPAPDPGSGQQRECSRGRCRQQAESRLHGFGGDHQSRFQDREVLPSGTLRNQ